MSTPGTNYLIADHNRLLLEGRLAVCNSTDRIFDTDTVQVLDRLRTREGEVQVGFRCPACRGRHDDRRAPSGAEGRRMGYTVLKAQRQATPTGGSR